MGHEKPEPEADKTHDLTEGERPTQGLDAAEIVAADLPANRRIGPYWILSELGHGGMGSVYLAARADQQYEKRVAIKLIRGGAPRGDVVERFRRERQILARLDHPNIARLLDGGTTEDGLPYFVMEYIEGAPLSRYADSRRLSTAQRIELFRLVCSAVDYAHRSLIVHRDLKPGNILVTAEGVPRLLDFGIAKLVDADTGTEGAPATSMAMTPAYASPEQVKGEPVTTASDVYSLGVVLYELLTGRQPYKVQSGNPLELMKAVCEQEAELPSTAVARPTEPDRSTGVATATAEAVSAVRDGSPERLRHRLRGDLDNIVLRALRKEPAQRYPSVAALSEDLQRYLDGRPVLARRATVGYRAAKFVRRNRWGVAAASLVLLLCCGAAVSTAVQSARVARERDKAQRVSRFLVELFRVSDPGEARGNTVTAREMLDKGAERIHSELKEEPEVRSALLDTIGAVYDSLGLYDKAVPLLKEALDLKRRGLGSDHPEVAAALNSLGNVLLDKGDTKDAEAAYREALAIRRRRLPKGSREVAESLNNLASAADAGGRYDEAEALFREALEIKKQLPGQEHAVATTLGNLAIMRARKGDWGVAETLLREQIALQRKVLGNDHPELAAAMEMLATVLDSEGDYSSAESLHREALALQQRLLGPEHPDIELTIVNLAATLLHEGKIGEAEPLYEQAVALSRKFFGDESTDVAAALAGLAQVAEASDHLAKAEADWRAALALRTKAQGAEHSETAETLAGLAGVLRRRGSLREAEEAYRRALTLLRASLPPGHLVVADALVGHARALADLGRCADAEPLLTEAARTFGAAPERLRWRSSEAEGVLGACLVTLNRRREAEPLLVRSLAVLTAARGERSPEAREARERLAVLRASERPES